MTTPLNQPSDPRPITQRQLDWMTWAEAQHYSEAGGDAAILPVGSVEMHGPHLPLGNDYLTAWAVARLAAARCQAVILPPLPYTWTGATRPYAGTLSIPADVVITFVKAICFALIEHGFRRIVLASIHGPDTWTLSLAGRQVFEERHVPVAFFNPYPVGNTARLLPELSAELTAREEQDPGFTETSCLLAALEVLGSPELVDLTAPVLLLVPQPEAQQRVRSLGTVGFYYTDPSQHVPKPRNPSAEIGRRWLEAAAEQLALLVEGLKMHIPGLNTAVPPGESN
ncbi:MAG: creatininase family protein [Chloroflexi bacterium]|nr:creatininase family protein [Chloroflexota bacterium]